jgi:uncharacterized membrane protein
MKRSSDRLDYWTVAAGVAAAVLLGAAIASSARASKKTPLVARGAITILKSRDEVYARWRNLENLPRFMGHVLAIEDLGDGRSRWTVKGPLGSELEWTARITEDESAERIAWSAVEPKDLDHQGEISFEDAPGGRGTEVRVRMAYGPPGGRFSAIMTALTGNAPEQAIDADLRRFKAWLETGEIPTTAGQSAARRIGKSTTPKALEHVADAATLLGSEARP